MNGPREPLKDDEEYQRLLRRQWQALHGRILQQEVLDRFETGYGTKFSPTDKRQEAVPISEYISSAFYLMDSPAELRETHGFNSFYDLEGQSSTRDGLRLVR